MGPTITATIYGACAIIAAWFFRPRAGMSPAIPRGALFWLVSTPLLFLLPQPMLALLVCGAVAVLIAPSRDNRGAYYCLVLLAVPAGVESTIPFPGINYLIALDWAKLAAIALLGPALLGASPAARKYAQAAGICMMLMFVLFGLQSFRTSNLTSGLRACVDLFLLYALPYFALIRLFFREREHFDRMAGVFVFIGALFFFSAAISQFRSWNYYTYLIERMGVPVFADFRGGLLRVAVTLTTVLAGYIMTMALLSAEYFRSERRISAMMAWVYRVMFIAAAAFTVSRGAWVAMFVGLATYYFFTNAPRSLRPLVIGATFFVGLPVGLYVLMSADLGAIDQYGSFEYRRELLRATWAHVQEFPLFGDALFYESPDFAHLYQGQGIIDFVNYYVQIVLEHGIVGLALFIGPFVFVILGLLGLGGAPHFRQDRTFERQRATILGIIAAYLVLMMTTSAVSYGAHLGVIVLALGAAFLAAARKEVLQPAAVPADMGSLASDARSRKGLTGAKCEPT